MVDYKFEWDFEQTREENLPKVAAVEQRGA